MSTDRNAATAGMFDQEVEAYERARPSYPDALFADLISYLAEGGVTPPIDAVEIGPGTGKATASLLDRGFRVTAVEHGAEMSKFLRAKFHDDPHLTVVNARFEAAALKARSFDALIAATAFHWLEPALRLTKSHRLLRSRGTIAIIDGTQITSEVDRGFFDRCLPIYQRYRPDERHHSSPGEAEVIPAIYEEINASGLFSSVRLLRYGYDQTYPTEMYADLVRSYRRTQQQPRDEREAMIADLSALIDSEFDGYVVRPLVITLVMARPNR